MVRFLESSDTTFRHIAVWTLVQLLESGDAGLEQAIRSSKEILPLVSQIATGDEGSERDALGPSDSASQSESDEMNGESEVTNLARRVLELVGDGSEGAVE